MLANSSILPTTCAAPRAGLFPCRPWVGFLCRPLHHTQTSATALHSMMISERAHCGRSLDRQGDEQPIGLRRERGPVLRRTLHRGPRRLRRRCRGSVARRTRRARRKQRRLGPGLHHGGENDRVVGCTSADDWRETGQIGARLRRQRPAGCEMVFPARGTGIVGREESGNAVAVVQLAQIGGAGDDVVVRVIRIARRDGSADARRPTSRA